MKKIRILIWSMLTFVLFSTSMAHSNVRQYNNKAICHFATFLGSWSKTTINWVHVDEAARRGLSCGVTRTNPYASKYDTLAAMEFKKYSLTNRKLIQTALKAEGYYKLTIDGIWGKGTEVAVVQFGSNKDVNLKKSSTLINLYTYLATQGTKLNSRKYADCTKKGWSFAVNQCTNESLCILKKSLGRGFATKYEDELQKRGNSCGTNGQKLVTKKSIIKSEEKTCYEDPSLCTITQLCSNATASISGKKFGVLSLQKELMLTKQKTMGLLVM